MFRRYRLSIGLLLFNMIIIALTIMAVFWLVEQRRAPAGSLPISREEAIRSAQQRATEIGFDINQLTPVARIVDGAWEAPPQRKLSDPPVAGGDVTVLIDGQTGALLSTTATQ